MNIQPNLKNNKAVLLQYFRNRANEEYQSLSDEYKNNEYKEKTKVMNHYLIQSRNNVIDSIKETAAEENWDKKDLLECILMVEYTSNVVMLEERNSIWAYDYMAFSRRIGELWEPFCKVCFKHPLTKIKSYIPPLFSDVKRNLTYEIQAFIEQLNISSQEKEQLNKYYNKVWSLVTSGEIKLECDLHFTDGKTKYVVDFKSGFGSNEKGNTNRLLLVGAIYKTMEKDYDCLLFVRSNRNNHYLTTLENSGIWKAYCGDSTYKQIENFTGYDLKSWINKHINWMDDFTPAMASHVKDNQLEDYLKW